MKPQVFVVRLRHWEHQGSHQSAEDGQSTQRKGLVAVCMKQQEDRQGQKCRSKESRRGRDLETQERGRESKGQNGEWLTIAHLCRHVNADTDTKYRLSKCSVRFWI